MDTSAALKWGIAFLPGFLAFFVFGQIIDTADVKEFEFIFILVLLTLVTWLVAHPVVRLLNYLLTDPIRVDELHLVGTPILVLVGALVGLGFGVLSERNVFYGVLGLLPAETSIVSRKPVSEFLLDHNARGTMNESVDKRRMSAEDKPAQAWLEIQMEGGEVYQGNPANYSKGTALEEVFLSPACRVKAGVVSVHQGAGILLNSRFIRSIAFVDPSRSECGCLSDGGMWQSGRCSPPP